MGLDRINEMANISTDKTGLDVVIWLGIRPKSHAPRIKVSNIIGKFSKNDCFSIRLHDFTIDGDCRIKSSDLDKIKDFISKNKQNIISVSDGLMSTDQFIKNIIKV